MRSIKTALFAAVLLILAGGFFLPAHAEGGRVTLGGDIGLFYPIMEHNKTKQFEGTTSWAYGMHLSYGVSDHANILAGWAYTIQDVAITKYSSVRMIIQDVLLMARWTILTGTIRPMVSLGGVYNMVNLEFPINDDSGFGVRSNAGMEFMINQHLSLGFTADVEYLFLHDFDTAICLTGLGFVNFTF